MCDKDWIDISTALLTPTIAIAVALLTYYQWRTEESKRKQDLFDKRYDFFKRMWALYSSHMERPNEYAPLEMIDLLDYVHEAEFLFGKDILEHLLLIPEKQKKAVLDYDWFSQPFKKYIQMK